MKLSIGTRIYNTNQCIKHKDALKVTIDQPTPRVTFRKEELLCHQRHDTTSYFNWVTVYKYIDDSCVFTYSWIQDIEDDELKEFLELEELARQRKNLPPPPKDETPQERKKRLCREYYYQNKEKLKSKKHEWYQNHKEEIKKQYQDNKQSKIK